MTVYVDQSIFPFRGTLYCHVWADSIDELHAAAQRAGLKREWFQHPPYASWEHYDCSPSVRAKLVKHGAVETDRKGPWRWQTLQWFNGDNPVRFAMACERIRKHGPREDLFGPLI